MRKRLFFYTIIIFIVITVCSLFVWKFGEILEPTSMDLYNEQIDTFHALEKDSVDVIIYGSSHAWLGVDTVLLSDLCGINAYNYGCSWQSLDTTALFMADSFINQHPQVAIVDTFMVDSLLYEKMGPGELAYTRRIGDFEYKQLFLDRCFGDNWKGKVYYHIPFCEYHSNWDSLSEKSVTGESTNEYDFMETKGFRPGEEVKTVNLKKYDELPQLSLREESIEILDEMLAMCRKNGVTPIFVTLPCGGDYWYSDALKDYCGSRNVKYINYWEIMNSIEIDAEEDFADEAHLNTSGAGKVTSYLAEHIETIFQ